VKNKSIKNPTFPPLPWGTQIKDAAVAVGARIVSDGKTIKLLDPLGNSKEKHQESNMIFLTIQGFMMPPTSIAPLST
jgi:hypothetical protein